ncbi:hypothetical protein ONZ45_g10210 [Pleurotus djamor]|nr:hypothetical protein ONZ45_g10210 [Pleurotus djamor]
MRFLVRLIVNTIAISISNDSLLGSAVNDPSLIQYAVPETTQRHPSPSPQQGGERITKEWLCSLDPEECLWRFRFYASELIELSEQLKIPAPFITSSRYRFTPIEALGLLLARFKSPGTIHELTSKYNRSYAAISEVVNELSIRLDDTWAHLFETSPRNPLLSPSSLASYATAISLAGSPLSTIWGFIDCTIRYMCRPSQHQRQAYNGYKSRHALKYQAVMLPNGMIGLLHGPTEGRRNDNHLLHESGLVEWCTQNTLRPGANMSTPVQHRYFQLFGDPAYGISPVIMSPYAGSERSADEKSWNIAMSRLRIEVEHGFAGVTRDWPYLNVWWTHHIYQSPLGRYYRVGVLLTNCLNCFRPNQTSLAFDLPPPSLDRYLVS